jgi:microcystin-dependent protein
MIVQSTTLDTEAKVIAIYGGTSWSKIEGRVLVGEGTLDSTHSYTVGATGGEPEHKLTINEMPSHTHSQTTCYHSGNNSANGGNWGVYVSGGGNTGYTGGSQSHNIMQPYKVVYIWERTA